MRLKQEYSLRSAVLALPVGPDQNWSEAYKTSLLWLSPQHGQFCPHGHSFGYAAIPGEGVQW